MASAKQVKALLQSFKDGDDAQFYAVAMQLAAHEAKLGHGLFARELRDLIDQSKEHRNTNKKIPVPLTKPRGELSGLLSASYPKLKIADMILDERISSRLKRLISEHANVKKIRNHGLSPRKKLLLVGPPGTGKTLTASVLAGELGLPLFLVRLDNLMTKFMGETAGKLRLIFDAAEQTRGVYLFDEFDSIGSNRGLTNDVGEIRRVLNSFLQMIESDDSDSILIAATNHVELLDKALFRRFDDVIEYHLPDVREIEEVMKSKLGNYVDGHVSWDQLVMTANGLSYGDLTKVCGNAIKSALIRDLELVTNEDLAIAINEQQSHHQQ